MSWPTPQDYNEAIQNPRQNCADAELAAGVPELTDLGLPRPITGNFASVYRVHCAGRDWAVRCFWREYADMQQRYQAISRHLERAQLPYTVACEYLSRGIKVRGQWYPILKMEWVEGELLSTYAERHLHDPAMLEHLAQRWRRMVETLESAELAHGDLQHGNVLVVGDELKLVDYDGMYVPALAGNASHELGHQNYQHPRRGASDFGPTTDRFSALAIYLSLAALSRRPDLWKDLRAGDECLLFRHHDYIEPAGSEAFRRVEDQVGGEVGRVLVAFRSTLRELPSSAPRLEGLLNATENGAKTRSAGSQHLRALWRSVVPGGREVNESATLAAGPSPAWLRDYIPAGGAHESFRGPVLLPRISFGVAVAALAALIVAATSVSIPFLFVAVVCCLLLTVSACTVLLSFHHDQSVRTLKVILRRERAQLRALAAIQREARRLEKGRARRDHEVARRDEQAARLQSARDERERAEREAAQAALEAARRLAGERRHKLQILQGKEIEALLAEMRARHVSGYLSHQTLRTARLPEAGKLLTARLWLMGIRTAADVTPERIAQIRTIDAGANAAICTWRVEKQLEAKRSLPKALPTDTLEALTERYGRQRQTIEDVLRKREEKTAKLAAAICLRYRDLRAQDESGILTNHREHREACADIETLLSSCRQREALAATQLDRIRRELEPFSKITFGRYLTMIAGRIHDA